MGGQCSRMFLPQQSSHRSRRHWYFVTKRSMEGARRSQTVLAGRQAFIAIGCSMLSTVAGEVSGLVLTAARPCITSEIHLHWPLGCACSRPSMEHMLGPHSHASSCESTPHRLIHRARVLAGRKDAAQQGQCIRTRMSVGRNGYFLYLFKLSQNHPWAYCYTWRTCIKKCGNPMCSLIGGSHRCSLACVVVQVSIL